MSMEEQKLMENTNIYVDCVMESLPVSPTYRENLREQIKAQKDGQRMQYRNLCWKATGQSELHSQWKAAYFWKTHDL